MDPILRTDAALARPIVFDGPGESGITIMELVSSIITDLPYDGGKERERVTADALTLDLDEWIGLPVVFDDSGAHDAENIERDPKIQGESQIATVIGARFDAESGERIMRISVPRQGDAAKIRKTHNAVSEAYGREARLPTDAERRDRVTAVQTRRYPKSLALIDYRRGGRAGPRARVRTDGADMPDAEAGSLDALMEFLKGYTSKEAKMLVKAWLGDEVAPEPKPEEPVMDAVKPEEMAAIKADAAAQKLRADAAEARLLKIEAAEVAADLGRLDLKCDGFDAVAPTLESVAKASVLVTSTLRARLRTDAADYSGPHGERPATRVQKGDNTTVKPVVSASRFGGSPAAQE